MRLKRLRYGYLLILSLFSLLSAVSCSPAAMAPAEEIATHGVTISLPGTNNSTILVTSQGRLLKKTQITSSDGNISLYLDPGTILLDGNKTPLQSIKVVIDPITPLPPEDAEIIGAIVDIQPQGAFINPALKLTLTYNPLALPQGISENDVGVSNYTGSSWEMVRYKQVDAGANRITTNINQFGKYSVLAPTKPVAVAVSPSQPGLTSITLPKALTNGKPTLAEFGRGTCIPCQEMKPILENLAVEYQGRLNVPIVSVDDYRDLTNYYKVMAIPTQICFDSNGKEVYRHVGLWPKDQIITQLAKLGVK